jgi:hypothetical protein
MRAQGKNTLIMRVRKRTRIRSDLILILFDGLKLFAGLKPDGLPRRDADLCASAWIAPDACLAGTHVEDTEAPQLDAIAL